MIRRFFMLSLGMLGFGIVLGLGPGGRTEQPSGDGKLQGAASQQDGVEVLARGPIHEAFAEPSIRGPRSSPVISTEPPKSIEELAPDQKPVGDNVQWIPGYWAWDDDTSDFLWVSGTYRTVPPGRHWVPGYWNQAEDGWQWVAGLWADQAKADLELLPAPPDPPEEAVTEAPDSASIYQPGCWVYRENRYLWRNGFWLANRAGWLWSPACYTWTPGGHVFNEGYWDYPFRDRGLLFAPVNIERSHWSRPGWSYQPSYVVYDSFLLAALFVRPTYNHYYFGDYYGSNYDRLGFVPWTDHRYGRAIGDPLFGYYQWQNRDNPGWGRDMRQLYAARREDPAARPPRTLAQQNTVIQNISNSTTNVNNVTNITNVTALAPLTRVDNRFVKLQPVTRAQRVEAQKTSTQFRDFSSQRGKLEAQAGQSIQPATQPGVLAKPIRVALPDSRPAAITTAGGTNAKPPPGRPVMPQLDSKPKAGTDTGKRPEGQSPSGFEVAKPKGQPGAAPSNPAPAPAAQPRPAAAAPSNPAPAPRPPAAQPRPAAAAPSNPAPAPRPPAAQHGPPAPEHKPAPKKDK
jgi:WXXGXW repeat (2 copies)